MINKHHQVQDFYEEQGWREQNGVTLDAELNEDFRDCAKDYVSRCRRRLLRFIPRQGDEILDMASGPIQYPEYLEYSKGFAKRVCVDLSQRALDEAQRKIGVHGEFLCGDFLEMNMAADRFDAVISLHTIYHIHRDRQAEAVRKCLKLAKPNAPVIILYKNDREWSRPIILWFKRCLGKSDIPTGEVDLYHFAHPVTWWQQFCDVAKVEIFPWRSFSARHQKLFFPNSRVGKWMFRLLFRLEDAFPQFFVRHFKFSMVVLQKHA